MYIRSLVMVIKYQTITHEWIKDLVVVTFLLSTYPRLAWYIAYPVNARKHYWLRLQKLSGFNSLIWGYSIYTKTVGRGRTNMSHWTIFPFNPTIKSFFPFYSLCGIPTEINNIICTLHSLHKSMLWILSKLIKIPFRYWLANNLIGDFFFKPCQHISDTITIMTIQY